MAPLYVDNHLYTEALMAHQKASIYALKAGDIYQYIRGKELIGGDYYAMGDTLQAIAIAKSCIKLYEDNNMHKAAAAALPTIIYSFLLLCKRNMILPKSICINMKNKVAYFQMMI